MCRKACFHGHLKKVRVLLKVYRKTDCVGNQNEDTFSLERCLELLGEWFSYELKISVDERNIKGMPPFRKEHAFISLRQDADYFVFGAAGFFTAITVIEEAIIFPASFL